MKFVILDNKEIPNFGGVRGPMLTPTHYNLHDVLRWITFEIDIREVMDDGSYRKLEFNDERIMKEIDEELNRKRLEKENSSEAAVSTVQERPVVITPVEKVKKEKPRQPKVEPVKKEEPKKDEIVLDELEKME